MAWRLNWQTREISLAAAAIAIVYLVWQIRRGNRGELLRTGEPGAAVNKLATGGRQWQTINELPSEGASAEEKRRWLDDFLVKQQEEKND